MVKKIMTTLVLSVLLNVSHLFAMENPNPNPNPDTVDRIAGIIQDFGLKENNAETKDVILDALQGVEATDEDINEAFMKRESKGKETSKKQERRELTSTEKENAHKMMLMKQYFEDMAKEEVKEEERLPVVPRDVQNVIGGTLHEVSANPVLNGELVYTPQKGEKKLFKIMELIKEDGSIDLSNKDVFGDAADHLLITTDPEKFFNVIQNSKRLIILIAPKFLIEEKLESPAVKHFQPIMGKWKEDKAPIGIFFRMESWDDLSGYDYLTNVNLVTLSENNLFKNWKETKTTRDSKWSRDYLGWDRQSAMWNFKFIFIKN